MKTAKEDAPLEMRKTAYSSFLLNTGTKMLQAFAFLYLHRFKPLKDEVAHSISKKYQLYKG